MFKIEKYNNMIDYLLLDVSIYNIDDLKQELYLKLLEILNSEKSNIRNLDNYIFISLRNKKIEVLRKLKKENYISLNQQVNSHDETELIELIADLDKEISVDCVRKREFVANINFYIKHILTKKEQIFFKEYFFNNKKQKIIASQYHVTPQAVNNTIKRAIIKIKNYYYQVVA